MCTSVELCSHLLNNFAGALVHVAGCVPENGDSGSKQTIQAVGVCGETVAMRSPVVLDAEARRPIEEVQARYKCPVSVADRDLGLWLG